jgi:hypothetical protein
VSIVDLFKVVHERIAETALSFEFETVSGRMDQLDVGEVGGSDGDRGIERALNHELVAGFASVGCEALEPQAETHLERLFSHGDRAFAHFGGLRNFAQRLHTDFVDGFHLRALVELISGR